MNINYYDILGVEKTASEKEIKTAFRTLAHKHHPDKGGDEKKFKEINEAYQTLSNKDKRVQYDRFGSVGGNFGNGRGFNGANTGFNYGDFARAAGRNTQFKMFSLKKIPLIAWILLIPLLLFIAVIGIGFMLIYLFVITLRRLHKA